MMKDYTKICASCINSSPDVSSANLTIKSMTNELYCDLTLIFHNRTHSCNNYVHKSIINEIDELNRLQYVNSKKIKHETS